MNTELFDRLGDPERMMRIAGYDITDPRLRERLDAVAERAAKLLEAPISLVSFVLDSSLYIVGSHGLSGWVAQAQGMPAEWSMCTHAVLNGRPYCIGDGAADPLHADNPLLEMTKLRSYLGVPLVDEGGHALGAHCVMDVRPRMFGTVDIAVLSDGAQEALAILAEHRVR